MLRDTILYIGRLSDFNFWWIIPLIVTSQPYPKLRREPKKFSAQKRFHRRFPQSPVTWNNCVAYHFTQVSNQKITQHTQFEVRLTSLNKSTNTQNLNQIKSNLLTLIDTCCSAIISGFADFIFTIDFLQINLSYVKIILKTESVCTEII